jgi:protein-S-isoprenylcysteine O-methyltransferase Ste14
MGIEKTTTLVTSGAYRYIRHPVYGSLLYGTLGVFLKNPSLVAGLLAMTSMGLLVITARVEEAECLEFFGTSYKEYMRRTKMFIPFVF